MDNRTVEQAIHYHELTKRGLEDHPKLGKQQHRKAKAYVGATVIPLEQNVPMLSMSTFETLANTEFDEEIEVDAVCLSQIVEAAAGLMRRHSNEHAECTTELYLVTSGTPSLQAGVYHVDANAFVLNQLREGDHRPDLVATAGDNQSLAAAPMTLILSGVFSRSYRNILAETGRILARILAAASAARLAASVEMSFVDTQVNRLLGLDGRSEGALCLIPVGRSLDWAEHVGERELPEVKATTEPQLLDGSLAAGASEMHSASSLFSNEETRPMRGPWPRPTPRNRNGTPLDLSLKQSRPLSEVFREQSKHGYSGNSMDLRELSALLHHTAADLQADFREGPETSLLDPYLVVHRVAGLEAGLYAFPPGATGLTRVQAGDLRTALEESLALPSAGPDAAAHLILASDLSTVLERFGNRGYRLVQVEAGIMAGRFGLAAQSMRLAAPICDFFDDAMSRFLSPYADGKQVILTLGLG